MIYESVNGSYMLLGEDASIPTSPSVDFVFRIGRHRNERRWMCERPGRPAEPITLRDLVGLVEEYEPAFSFTAAVIEQHSRAVAALRKELARFATSKLTLNRRLREEAQRHVARGEASMSEIAMRCGRMKTSRIGNVSGETSWLARRLGIAPEGGESTPTPWIHSDVLALIARQGLGVAPMDVELSWDVDIEAVTRKAVLL